jgi:hypothetical protein
VIGFGYDDIENGQGKRRQENGKSVKICSVRAGTAKVEISHHEMDSDYKKELYVYVHAHDANFSLDPTYLMMQVGQTLPVTAVLGGNLPEKDFSLISWETTDNEDGIKGIKLVEDNVEYDVQDGRQTVRVRAVAEGVCKLKSTFNNVVTLECSVYVEREKYLRLGIDGYQYLLPGQNVSIPVSVSPADSVITWQTDYLDYLGYLEGKDYKIEIVPSTGSERYINVRGGEREGVTNLKIVANGIERMISFNTNYNFAFGLLDPKVIRIEPFKTGTIGYDVHPQGDTVTFLNGGYDGAWDSIGDGTTVPVVAVDGGIDSENQIISITGLRAGYTIMNYESAYNKQNGLELKVPVYIYYDRKVDIEWEITKVEGATFDSSFDPYVNVIKVADGETVALDMKHVGVDNEKFIAGYPGLYYTFGEISNSNSLNGASARKDINKNEIRISNGQEGRGIKSTTGKNYIVSSTYAGYITVVYQYYNGGKTPSTFSKNFMIYAETWARRP